MTQSDLLAELRKLGMPERLQVLESALRSLGEDLQAQQRSLLAEKRQQLNQAAKALLPDYAPGKELTIFTDLDGEEFYGQG